MDTFTTNCSLNMFAVLIDTCQYCSLGQLKKAIPPRQHRLCVAGVQYRSDR